MSNVSKVIIVRFKDNFFTRNPSRVLCLSNELGFYLFVKVCRYRSNTMLLFETIGVMTFFFDNFEILNKESEIKTIFIYYL